MEKTTQVDKRFIVITGAESTGKTQLAEELSEMLHCNRVPELSRQYVENLNRKYTYSDVEDIAHLQIKQFEEVINNNTGLTIFDTGLIITKVWFDVVFNQCPQWLIVAIKKLPVCLHLLCDTDLPWMPDPVRENGGEMRIKLSNIYKNEIIKFGFPYFIVSGKGDERLKNAITGIKKFGV
jgi:nicotinamide riboside kinase